MTPLAKQLPPSAGSRTREEIIHALRIVLYCPKYANQAQRSLPMAAICVFAEIGAFAFGGVHGAREAKEDEGRAA